MEAADFIAEALERVRTSTLNAVTDLSQEEIGWRPDNQSNSTAFLVFHIFRTADSIFTRINPDQSPFWEAGNWSRRWTLPTPPADAEPAWSTGHGWTQEDLAAFEPPELEDLLGYGAAVQWRGLKQVRAMDAARLDEQANARATVAQSLLTAITHEAAHTGQIEYLLGLMRASAAS